MIQLISQKKIENLAEKLRVRWLILASSSMRENNKEIWKTIMVICHILKHIPAQLIFCDLLVISGTEKINPDK